MTIRVAFDVDPAKAVMAGNEPPPYSRGHVAVVDVGIDALSPELRRELAQWTYFPDEEVRKATGATFYVHGRYGPFLKAEGSKSEHLYRLLEAHAAKRQDEDADKAAREAREAAKQEAKLSELRRRTPDQWVVRGQQVHHEGVYYDVFCVESSPFGHTEEFADVRASAAAIAESKTREARASAVATADAQKLVRASKQKALADWARDHGSERLRLLIRRGFNFEEEARDEYAADVTKFLEDEPFFLQEAPPEGEARSATTPTTEELELFDKVCDLAAALGLSVTLVEVTRRGDGRYDDANTVSTELSVLVKTPDDRDYYRYFTVTPAHEVVLDE